MTNQKPNPNKETLREGDQIVMIDSRQRRYLINLTEDKEFHTHAGVVAHNDIIGKPEGTEFRTGSNAKLLALRPTLSDHVLKMPRGAQVIYPKDLGAILMLADIYPGVKVFESGLGSGALSTTLLRAGAEICGYEIREDFANNAKENVEKFLGVDALKNYDVHLRNAYESIEHTGFDRAVLDIPEPWQVVPHLLDSLRKGGILVAYNPSIMQVSKLRDTLASGPWSMIESVEVMHRGWHVEGHAVRPDHRMVGHTGFLTHARLLNH